MQVTSIKPLTDQSGEPLFLGQGGVFEVLLQVEIDSMLNTLLDAIVQDLVGLRLELVYTQTTVVNGVNVTVPTPQPAAVVKRKGVKREPGVDQPFQITVCKSDLPEEQEYLAFGKSTTRWILEITIVAPNQKDWLTNLDQYAKMREAMRSLYLPPTWTTTALGVAAGVWEVRVDPRGFLDRDQMANMFDDQTLHLLVRTTP